MSYPDEADIWYEDAYYGRPRDQHGRIPAVTLDTIEDNEEEYDRDDRYDQNWIF